MAEALPDATPEIDLEAAKKELQKGPAEANKQNLSSLVDKTFDELKINDIKNLGKSVHGTIFLLGKLSERGARPKDGTPNTIDKQDTQESLAHKFQSGILFSDKFADKLAAMKTVIDSNRTNLTNQGDAHIQGLLQQFDDLNKTAEGSAQSIHTETSQKVADLTYKMSADDFDKYGLTKLAPETKKQLKSLCDLDGSNSAKFLFLKKLIGKGPQDNIIGERQLYGILGSGEQAKSGYIKEVFERILPGGDMNKPADIKTFQQKLLQKTADVSLLAQAATGNANVSADIATVLNGDDETYIINLLRVNKDHIEDIGKKDPNLGKKIYEAALSMGAAVAFQVATLGRGYFAVDSHEITVDKVKTNPNSRSFLAYTLGDGGQNITAKFRLVAAELQLNVNDNEGRVIKKTVDFVSQLDNAFKEGNNDPNKLDVIIKNTSPSAKSVLEQYKSKPELFNDVEALKNALTKDYLIQQIHEAAKDGWNIKGLMAAIDLKGDTFAGLTFQKMKVDVKDGKSSLAETAARETNIGELKWGEKDVNSFQERTDGIIKQTLKDGGYKYYFPHGADLGKGFSAETVSHPLGKKETDGKNIYCDVITSDAPLNIATKINVQRDGSMLVSYDLTKTPAVKKASEDKTTEAPVESVQNTAPIALEIQGDPDFQIAQEALEGKDFSELRRKYPKEFASLQQSIATGADMSQSWKIFEGIVDRANSQDLGTTKIRIKNTSDKTKAYFLSLLTNQNAGIVAFRNFGEEGYNKKSFGDVHKLTHTPEIERKYDNNDLSMFVGTEVRNDQLNKNLTFDKKRQQWSPKDATNEKWKQYAAYLNEKGDYRRTQVAQLDVSKAKTKPETETPIDPDKGYFTLMSFAQSNTGFRGLKSWPLDKVIKGSEAPINTMTDSMKAKVIDAIFADKRWTSRVDAMLTAVNKNATPDQQLNREEMKQVLSGKTIKGVTLDKQLSFTRAEFSVCANESMLIGKPSFKREGKPPIPPPEVPPVSDTDVGLSALAGEKHGHVTGVSLGAQINPTDTPEVPEQSKSNPSSQTDSQVIDANQINPANNSTIITPVDTVKNPLIDETKTTIIKVGARPKQ